MKIVILISALIFSVFAKAQVTPDAIQSTPNMPEGQKDISPLAGWKAKDPWRNPYVLQAPPGAGSQKTFSLDYLIKAQTNAIDELSRKIESLEKRISDLEQREND